MSKKVVALIGSYRKGRVIDTAVTEALRAAESLGAETEKIYLTDTHIEFCTNCRSCTQQPGPQRGDCVLTDQMAEVLEKLASADAIVLASPANFYNVTAITRRFIERLLGAAFWPWDANKPPAMRTKKATARALLITSAACPAFIARLLIPGPVRALKNAAKCLFAKPVKTLYFGSVAASADATLSDKQKRRAFAAGLKLLSA